MGTRDETFDLGLNHDSDLGNFLSRPLKIHTATWAVGGAMTFNINPWSLFLDNTNVRDRLRKYFLLRGDLNIKIVINGNGFYYGKAVAAYHPLNAYDAVFANSSAGGSDDATLMAYTQLPRVIIDATESQGGEMKLPYLYPRNWLDITQANWDELGLLRVKSFVNLLHANGATESIDVNVFAWLSDVKLTVPTTIDPGDLAVFQSGEYGKGIISKTASTIAGVASVLKNVPIIGTYARATETVSNTVGNVARMLGMSRPPVLDTIKPMKPRFAGLMAVTDADELVEKLALDSKQELTIDPRVVGMCSRDEMSFSSILTRESYLTQFPWATTSVPGTLLWNSRVDPALANSGVSTANATPMMSMTPMGHLSQMFKYWTGDIIFRFSIVASAFHKGRLRITVDPAYFGGVGGDEWNAVYSRVVDISEERDFTMRIGWMQPEAFRPVRPLTELTNGHSLVAFAAVDARSNGMIRVEVLNNLTTPNIASTGIDVLVFVEGGDNLRFMAPTHENIATTSYFDHAEAPSFEETKAEYQSGEMKECDTPSPCGTNAQPTVAVGVTADNNFDSTPLVYGGEVITSVRALLKRYWFLRGSGRFGTSASFKQNHLFRYPNRPSYRGFDTTNGMDQTNLGTAYNFSTVSAISWFTPCYAIRRGAYRYKYFPASTGPAEETDMTVSRYDVAISFYIGIASTASSGEPTTIPSLAQAANSPLGTGGSFTNVRNQPVSEVDLPFYSPYRFAFARVLDTKGTDADDTVIQNHEVSVGMKAGSTQTSFLKQFGATGEDFMLSMYMHAPTVFVYDDPPPYIPP